MASDAEAIAARWGKYARRVQIVGLLVAATALCARWAGGDISPAIVPPGLVILVVVTALVIMLGRAPAVLVAVAASGFLAARLLTRTASGAAPLSWWIELGGLALTVLAGLLWLVAASVARRSGAGPRRVWGRRAQVAGLLLLAPICAEYLSAYDESTGDPLQLAANLLVFVPLYGCSALLIREVARRAGLGWTGIVLLAAAFGLLEAGVVDQALFSPDYRQIEGWNEGFRATLIAPLGLSAVNFGNFVGGHVVFSICGPIALVEAARPRSASTPWLGWRGIVIAAIAYAGASVLVLTFHLQTETSHASAGQVIISLVLVVALVAGAFGWGRRRTAALSPRTAPRVSTTLGAALLLALAHAVAPESWVGVGVIVAVFTVAAVAVARYSRTTGWTSRHVAAVAAAPLLVRAVVAFGYDPLIGEVSAAAKYAHNSVLLALILAVTVLALRRPRTARSSGRSPGVVAAESTS